jgi:hypothetical protein
LTSGRYKLADSSLDAIGLHPQNLSFDRFEYTELPPFPRPFGGFSTVDPSLMRSVVRLISGYPGLYAGYLSTMTAPSPCRSRL